MRKIHKSWLDFILTYDSTLVGKIADLKGKSFISVKRWLLSGSDELENISVLEVIVFHFQLEDVGELFVEKPVKEAA